MKLILALLTLAGLQTANAQAPYAQSCREVCKVYSTDEAEMQILRLRRACFTITKIYSFNYGSTKQVCFDGCSNECKTSQEYSTLN